MPLLDTILAQHSFPPQRVALPECHDEIMMRAAARLVDCGYASVLAVGNESELRRLCDERGIPQNTFTFVSTDDHDHIEDVATRYASIPGMFLGKKALARRCADPLYLSLVLEAVGEADVAFGGIIATTGEVISAGQLVLGMAKGAQVISSVALTLFPGLGVGENGMLAYGDSAACVNPSVEELASIAINSCETVAQLMGWEPRCALISHSTCGSAVNNLTQKVVDAVELAHELRPDLAIDGEFQLDTALLPRVAARKVKRESEVAGRANIVIWPNLDVGNTCAKAFGLIPGREGAGPFLQGFPKIVGDCSRGASIDNVVDSIAVACLRAARLKGEA